MTKLFNKNTISNKLHPNPILNLNLIIAVIIINFKI